MLQESYSLSGELPVFRYMDKTQNSDVDPEYLLARIAFGEMPNSAARQGRIFTGLKQLSGQYPLEEVWIGKDKINRGVDNDVIWGTDDHYLFAAHYLDESGYSNLEEATYSCYRKLLSFVNEYEGYNPVRIWNYIPNINQIEGNSARENSLERYKRFSVGRFRAFEETGLGDDDYCSACAVGTHGNLGIVYLLASRYPGIHFENPNQVSAFKYPEKYGPRSPSFARATLATTPFGSHFFISGTASITGSESQHRGNLNKQLELTFENIQQLVDVVDSYTKFQYQPRPGLLKVYIRRPEDTEIIEKAVRHRFGDDTQVIYVQGDICRQELLVEIDGIWHM